MKLCTRLKKKDKDKLIEFFKNRSRNMVIQTKSDRVEAWDADNWVFVGGFYWSKRRRAWRFDSPRPYAHTVEDLDLLLDEYQRDQRGLQQIEESWETFKGKPSQRRFRQYKGALAAFFLRLID